MTDVLEVNDLYFHTCRKFRIVPSGTKCKARKKTLASSSQLGVTFAVISDSELICFETRSVTENRLTKENMNIEVEDLKTKRIKLEAVEMINDIGINSDGTLLAVLNTTQKNVFVSIYKIKAILNELPKAFSKVRIGSDPTNKGSTFEWNPAFSDTFAVTSTDQSVMVCKIDINDGSKQSVVGSKKMGAVGTSISWSPKGKQLTIGDSAGKVIQLKPELEVVRSIMPPSDKQYLSEVVGLCWLATTEWMVSFSKDEKGTEVETYLMRCKKDKPPEWTIFNELSYGQSDLPPLLLSASELLVDWNMILVANSKTSQIVPLGKMTADWQTWTVDEGKEFYLPTTTDGLSTFPIGICVDRSAKEEVTLGFDGTSMKHVASPIVLCLTNDGILTAHHVISKIASMGNIQIQPENLSISGTVTPAVNFQTTQPVQKTPIGLAKPLTTQQISLPDKNNIGNSITITTPKIDKKVDVSTPLPKILEEPTKNEKTADPSNRKEELIAFIEKLKISRYETKDEVGKLFIGAQNARKAINECSEVVKESVDESKEVVNELKTLVKSIEELSERVKHTVKEMDFELEEKMELVAEIGDSERILEELRDIYEAEKLVRFNKLETSADLLSEKFGMCNEMMKKLKIVLAEQEAARKNSSVLSPLRVNLELNRLGSGKEVEMALKVMRNITKIIIDTKEKLQRNELEMGKIRSLKLMDRRVVEGTEKLTNSSIRVQQRPHDVTVFNNQKLSNSEVLQARKSILERFKGKRVVKTRKVNVETYLKVEPKTESCRKEVLDTSNLSNALLKLSMTPRRVMTNASIISNAVDFSFSRCDATTQADEPIPVKTVVVTVPVTTTVTAAPPPVTTSAMLPKTTTTLASSSSGAPLFSKNLSPPKPFEVKKEEPLAPAEDTKSPISIKPAPPTTTTPTVPSSLFSGSLFGNKKEIQTLTETTTTIFGTGKKLNEEVRENKEQEEVELPKIEEGPKKEDEKQKEDVKIEEKTEEIVREKPKVELSANEPVMRMETPKKPQETPSFSFSTTTNTTPKPTSIFGGSGAGKSSIFGGTAAAAAPAVSSSFGSFGQQQQQPQQTEPNTNIGFSFNTVAKPASSSFLGASFGGGGAPKPSGFAAAAAAVAAQDDGMEDDSMGNGTTSGAIFGSGGGFMSGLGSSISTQQQQASGANLFGAMKTGNSGAAPASNSWLFGGGGGGAGQQQQNKPASFSFASSAAQVAQQQPASQTSIFGGGAKFGGKPAFGGGGGALGKNASIFGGAAPATGSAPSNSGFAQFAAGGRGGGGSSLFGGGASNANNTTRSSSVFGGSSQPTETSGSIFGGGAKTSSFNSWR